jgi:UbiD family decarboxylase
MLSNEPFFETLRDLLLHLERIGKLQRISKTVDKDWEIACITRQVMYQPPDHRYAILFESVAGFDTPVATNTLGASRELYATALGVSSKNGQIDKEAIHSRWVQALAAPLAPIVAKTGPCKENVMRGDAVDLLKFPIPTWTPGGDAGAYLSAGAVVQKDPETGIQNVGVYRGMIKSRNRIGILVQPAKHSGVIFQKYEAASMPMPVAIVVGPPPYLGMTSVGRVPFGVDEISVAGALSGRAMEVVKCETVDLFVPAYCEMVIEGVVSPGVREKEGPFGEFYGHMGPPACSPIATTRSGRRARAYRSIHPCRRSRRSIPARSASTPRASIPIRRARCPRPRCSRTSLPLGRATVFRRCSIDDVAPHQ